MGSRFLDWNYSFGAPHLTCPRYVRYGIFEPSELARVEKALKSAFSTLRARGLFLEAEADAPHKQLTKMCLRHISEGTDDALLVESVVEAFLNSD